MPTSQAYSKALDALENREPIATVGPLLKAMADLGETDCFGLTIGMHAVALGDLEAVEAAHPLSASFQKRNPRTGANLLHYAAQALQGGAEIIRSVIVKAPPEMLRERILRQVGDREVGNGHTVAMEAVFNNSAGVIDTLLELAAPKREPAEPGHEVDFTTPALTGWTPRGMALRQRRAFADRLPPAGQRFDDAAAAATEFARQADAEWLTKHPQDGGRPGSWRRRCAPTSSGVGARRLRICSNKHLRRASGSTSFTAGWANPC